MVGLPKEQGSDFKNSGRNVALHWRNRGHARQQSSKYSTAGRQRHQKNDCQDKTGTWRRNEHGGPKFLDASPAAPGHRRIRRGSTTGWWVQQLGRFSVSTFRAPRFGHGSSTHLTVPLLSSSIGVASPLVVILPGLRWQPGPRTSVAVSHNPRLILPLPEVPCEMLLLTLHLITLGSPIHSAFTSEYHATNEDLVPLSHVNSACISSCSRSRDELATRG